MTILEVLNNSRERISTIDGDKPTMSPLDRANITIGKIELDTCVMLLNKGYPANFELGSMSHNQLAELPEYKSPSQLSALELIVELDKRDLMIMPTTTFGNTDSIQGTVDSLLKEYFTALYKGWRVAVKESYSIHELEEHLEELGYSVVKTEELEHLEYIKANHPC